MEFENVYFYDKKSVRDYTNKIPNEINNGLDDLRKRDTNFDDKLLEREMDLFRNIKAILSVYEQDTYKKEVKRLINLIEIFICLERLSFHNRCFKNDVNSIKSLVNGD